MHASNLLHLSLKIVDEVATRTIINELNFVAASDIFYRAISIDIL